jgi:hypothetical protein
MKCRLSGSVSSGCLRSAQPAAVLNNTPTLTFTTLVKTVIFSPPSLCRPSIALYSLRFSLNWNPCNSPNRSCRRRSFVLLSHSVEFMVVNLFGLF